MIHVNAQIDIEPGRLDEFLNAFRLLVPQVLAEVGCVAYEPTVDAASGIEGQAPARRDALIVVEQWQSVDALKAHLDAPHMHAFREQVGHLIKGLTLEITESV